MGFLTRTLFTKSETKNTKEEQKGMGILTTITKTITNLTQNIPTIRQPKPKYKLNNKYKHPITSYRNLQTLYLAQYNPVVFRCNKVFKNTALACDFTIDTDTRENDNLPTTEYLNRLWQQPGGYGTQQTWADMNALIWDSKDNIGDCFFEISTDENHNILNGFQYIHNDKIMWNNENECYQLIEQPEVLYEPNELIHIHEPDNRVSESPWGRCKLRAAQEYVALFTNAMRYNNDVLLNDGIDPNIIVSFDPNLKVNDVQAEMDRLQVQNEMQDEKRLLALKGATVQHLAYNNKDMHYLELLKFAEDGITRTYGVPPQLYGKIETANLGSGSGDSQKKDWKTNFDGESRFVENAFNTCLREHGFSERFHYGNIDVIDELYDAQVAQIYLQTGVKTRDEIRNEMGMDKLQTNSWDGYYR